MSSHTLRLLLALTFSFALTPVNPFTVNTAHAEDDDEHEVIPSQTPGVIQWVSGRMRLNPDHTVSVVFNNNTILQLSNFKWGATTATTGGYIGSSVSTQGRVDLIFTGLHESDIRSSSSSAEHVQNVLVSSFVPMQQNGQTWVPDLAITPAQVTSDRGTRLNYTDLMFVMPRISRSGFGSAHLSGYVLMNSDSASGTTSNSESETPHELSSKYKYIKQGGAASQPREFTRPGVNYGLHFDDIALFGQSSSQEFIGARIVTYDRATGVISYMEHHDRDQRFSSLPFEATRGRPIAELGQAFWTGKSAISLQLNQGTEIALGTSDVRSRPSHGQTQGQPVIWSSNQEAILNALEGAPGTRVPLEERAAWDNLTTQALQEIARPTGGRGRLFRFIRFSSAVLNQVPGLPNQVIEQLIQIGQINNALYIKVPRGYSSASLNTIALTGQLQEFFRGSNSDGEKRTVFLDLTEDHATGSERISAAFHDFMEACSYEYFNFGQVFVLGRQGHSELNRDAHSQISIVSYGDEWLNEAGAVRTIETNLARDFSSVTRADVSQILEQIRRNQRETWNPLRDLSQLIKGLKKVFENDSVQLTQTENRPALLERVGRMFVQLVESRRVGPFGRSVLETVDQLTRRLTVPSEAPGETTILGQTQTIQQIEARIMAWTARGHRTRGTLPFFFVGPSGTGKTLTATRVANALQAAQQTLSMSRFAVEERNTSTSSGPSYTSRLLGFMGFEDPAESQAQRQMQSAINAIQHAVEQLVLDPNPVKVLILDEIHSYPEIFNHLLPAFGDQDSRMGGILNFEGIIVIMTANVDEQVESYARAAQAASGSRSNIEALVDLISTSMSSTDRVDAKIVKATVKRLLSGLFFYRSASVDPVQQGSMLESLIEEFETQNRCRVVLNDSARALLLQTAVTHQSGGYRSIQEAMREVVNTALGRFLARNSTEHGYFLLTTSARQNGRPELEFLSLTGDQSGLHLAVEDTFQRFSRAVRESVAYGVETLDRESPEVLGASETRSSLGTFALAYERLAQQTLLDLSAEIASVKPGAEEIVLDTGFSPQNVAQLKNYLKAQLEPIFREFEQMQLTPSDQSSMERQAIRVQQINKLLVALNRIYMTEATSAGSKVFADWVERIRVGHLAGSNPSGAPGVGPLIGPHSMEARAVAAAYLVDWYGRGFSRVMLSDMRSQARNNSFINPGTLVDNAGARAASAECSRILTGGVHASQELDQILRLR